MNAMFLLYKYNNGGKYLKNAGCSSSVDVEPECIRARGQLGFVLTCSRVTIKSFVILAPVSSNSLL